MEPITRIIINKNRGWRGLAEVRCDSADKKGVYTQIFSFSQPVWDDMLGGRMVLQNPDNYIVVHFDNLAALPRGQRSVLLKNFTANVTETHVIPKKDWMSNCPSKAEYDAIYHFIKNRNNHTTSDWNCIGIRVVPMI